MSTSKGACNYSVLGPSAEHLELRIVRMHFSLVLSLIIVAIHVGVGSFARHYRRHASIRLLSLGAYTLFLPLVSYVVSDIDKENNKLPDGIQCSDNASMYLLVWASLVHIIGSNYCTGNEADDAEGPSVGPTVQLLVGAIWILLLVVQHLIRYRYFDPIVYWIILIPCALHIVKVLAKLYAYYKSRRSFEVGHNPRLISGYTQQSNFPLLVMGEDKQEVVEGPCGYLFKPNSINSSLVTMEKVKASSNGTVFSSWPPYEDLCFSFSLFKLLRQRFSSRSAVEAPVPNFKVKLQDDPQGIVSIIAAELSFARDFYYSHLPVSYSSWWLPMVNIVLSFIVIAYCSATVIFLLLRAWLAPDVYQMTCKLACGKEFELAFGHIFVLDVLTSILAIALLLSEAWEIIMPYTCSNWTKIKLIYYYITTSSWQGSPLMKRLIRCMLRFRCKALNNKYKMGQASIMDTNKKIVKAVRRLLQLPDQKFQYVEIKPVVNTAILNKFRESNCCNLPTVTATLQQSPIGNDILRSYQGEGTSDVILVWHIATCLYEIKYPLDERSSAHAITASQLSRYCAYLVSSAPELLPDDKVWSKKLYESIKTITEPIFSTSNVTLVQYDHIIRQFEKCSSNTELKNGVKVGKLLVAKPAEEGWGVLAGFWSAMVLYIAPSDNVVAHREAIARGGELITILWAMLTHAGIISRPTAGNVV